MLRNADDLENLLLSVIYVYAKICRTARYTKYSVYFIAVLDGCHFILNNKVLLICIDYK